MTGFEITQWAMTAVLAVGLGATWIRNGRADRDKFTELKTIVKGIKEDLDNEETGLGALAGKLGEMKAHCSGMTSTFAEKLSGHDREISEVKKKVNTINSP